MSTLASSSTYAGIAKKYAGIAKTYAALANWLIGPLLLANLAVCVYIVARRTEPLSPREPDTVVTAADRLFELMKDYSAALQNVASLAVYPNDAEKQAGKNAVKRVTVDVELARLALARLDERRDRDSLLQFLATACGVAPITGDCATIVPPSFSHMDVGKFEGNQYIAGKETKYANTSQLESTHDDFVVLLTAMLKDAR
jgi:hypothetical protein